jgi:hypothetical protein
MAVEKAGPPGCNVDKKRQLISVIPRLAQVPNFVTNLLSQIRASPQIDLIDTDVGKKQITKV